MISIGNVCDADAEGKRRGSRSGTSFAGANALWPFLLTTHLPLPSTPPPKDDGFSTVGLLGTRLMRARARPRTELGSGAAVPSRSPEGSPIPQRTQSAAHRWAPFDAGSPRKAAAMLALAAQFVGAAFAGYVLLNVATFAVVPRANTRFRYIVPTRLRYQAAALLSPGAMLFVLGCCALRLLLPFTPFALLRVLNRPQRLVPSMGCTWRLDPRGYFVGFSKKHLQTLLDLGVHYTLLSVEHTGIQYPSTHAGAPPAEWCRQYLVHCCLYGPPYGMPFLYDNETKTWTLELAGSAVLPYRFCRYDDVRVVVALVESPCAHNVRYRGRRYNVQVETESALSRPLNYDVTLVRRRNTAPCRLAPDAPECAKLQHAVALMSMVSPLMYHSSVHFPFQDIMCAWLTHGGGDGGSVPLLERIFRSHCVGAYYNTSEVKSLTHPNNSVLDTYDMSATGPFPLAAEDFFLINSSVCSTQ